MNQTSDQKIKERIEEEIEDDAETSAITGYDTENQLGNNLITVTLAFLALISAAIFSSSEVLGELNLFQKIIIILSLALFSVSIIIGLANYFANMRFHQKLSTNYKFNTNQASAVKRHRQAGRSGMLLFMQIILLMIGLILTIVYVATMLFTTSNLV